MLKFIKHLIARKATEADLRDMGWANTRVRADMTIRHSQDMADLEKRLTDRMDNQEKNLFKLDNMFYDLQISTEMDQTMLTLTARNIIKVHNYVAALVSYLGLRAECDDQGVYKISPAKLSNRIDKSGKKK